MITYNEFKKEVEENLIFHMPERFRDGTWKAFAKSISKINETLDGISIVNTEKHGAYPTLYINDFYKDVSAGKTVDNVIDEMADIIVNALGNIPASVNDMAVRNIDEDKIFYQIVNRKQNNEMLKDVPHRDYLDFAIIYRVAVEINDNHIASAVITNELANRSGYSEENLYNLAEVNTPRLFPVKVANIMELLINMIPEADIEAFPEDEAVPMYVVTNTYENNGAAVGFLYRNVLHDLAEKLKCTELYILPSSIHEIIAIPADEADEVAGIEKLVEMVMEVNSQQVNLPERLSNQVYLYNSVLDVTTIVTRACESLD